MHETPPAQRSPSRPDPERPRAEAAVPPGHKTFLRGDCRSTQALNVHAQRLPPRPDTKRSCGHGPARHAPSACIYPAGSASAVRVPADTPRDMPARVRDKPRGVPPRCPASPLMPMNAPRGMPLRNVPAPADAPEAPPDRTRAACPFALQRPSLILSQSHVYAACPEQWPRARPSPPGPSARTPPVLRETRSKKGPAGGQPTASNAESPTKSRVQKERAAFPLARHPAAINERLFAPQKKRACPGVQAHPPKGERARPSPPGTSARTPPVPREPRGKSPPGGNQPTASNARAAFSLSSPRLSRNTAANGHAPWEERGLFASTRAVSPAGRF